MRALGQTPQWSVARLFKIISPPFLPFMAAIVASRMAGGASQDPVSAHSTESRSKQGTTIRRGRYGAIDDTRRWRVTAITSGNVRFGSVTIRSMVVCRRSCSDQSVPSAMFARCRTLRAAC